MQTSGGRGPDLCFGCDISVPALGTAACVRAAVARGEGVHGLAHVWRSAGASMRHKLRLLDSVMEAATLAHACTWRLFTMGLHLLRAFERPASRTATATPRDRRMLRESLELSVSVWNNQNLRCVTRRTAMISEPSRGAARHCIGGGKLLATSPAWMPNT